MPSVSSLPSISRPEKISRSFKDRAFGTAKAIAEKASDSLKLRDNYRLANRSNGSATLVTMLIGYKPDLWALIIPGLVRALPPGSDVCLISPGKFVTAVDDIARAHGWSYLSTSTNDVGLAQNVCFNLHEKAELIVKVDEDMFLLPDSLTGTIDFYRKTQAEGVIDPGFASPMIPINGVCYRPLLQAIGKLEEYEATFAKAKFSTSGLPLQDSAEVACWIWEATGPLAKTLETLREAKLQPILSSIQFSIGAIVFERSFWQDFKKFPVLRHQLMMKRTTLGTDERHMCKAAVEWFKPGIVCPTTLAGHFSFGPQYNGVKELLQSQPHLFYIG